MLNRLCEVLARLRTTPLGEAAFWVTAGNFVVFATARGAGRLLVTLFPGRRVCEPAPPVR